MFFIGVFGTNTGVKEITKRNNIICPKCGRLSQALIVRTYSYFHVFFIPTFRWDAHYIATFACCGATYEIDPDKGRELKDDPDTHISDADFIKAQRRYHGPAHCPGCRAPVHDEFEFCPHCGRRLNHF